MAPEYAMRGHYSIKSDVFSFGVLILEIVTGRRNGGSYSSDESADLLSLVSAYCIANTKLCAPVILYFTSLEQQLNNIKVIWLSNAGVGALDDGNINGDHGFILEQPCSARPDVEVHPHRAPLCSRRPRR